MATISVPGQLSRTRLYSNGAPSDFTVTADEKSVLFLRSRTGDDAAHCLWALDVETGAERLLAEGTINAYATDAAGTLAAFARSGGLWTVRVETGELNQLPATQPVSDPRPDPSGRHIAYVCDGALRVIGADGTGDRELLAPDGPSVTYGVADFAAEEVSQDGARGSWWSPDGTRLLVKRVDQAKVELWHTGDPADPETPARTKRYPSVGTTMPEVTLWIAGLDGARTEVVWDRSVFEYAPRGGWTRHGPYVVVMSRDQQTVQLLGIDASDGAIEVLHTLRDDCWVQPVDGLPACTDAGTVITHLDGEGTRYLVVDGMPVTPPGLQLRAMLGIEGERLLFTASTEPVEVHVWSYAPDEGLRRLSEDMGVHAGVRRGGTFVHVAGGTQFPGRRISVLRGGETVGQVASLAEEPALRLHVQRLVLGPRELRALLYRPSWYRPELGPLPVLVDPYGGAGLQRVTAVQDVHKFISQWFAEQGFAVLVADGSGTPGRGPDWEREVYGERFAPVLDDQVAALHAAAALHPELDLGRVAIRGWSYGGSLALVAVLRRPDVFHAAVSGAGVTDQRLYNGPWCERFLGQPDRHPDRYDAGLLLREAPKLVRPLLLMHGLADDNVYPLHTLRMSSALLAAGRPHEVLLLPGVGHRALAAPCAEALLNHQLRFLQRHLGVPARDVDQHSREDQDPTSESSTG
jgi:dipeptidyl-peptidase-4